MVLFFYLKGGAKHESNSKKEQRISINKCTKYTKRILTEEDLQTIDDKYKEKEETEQLNTEVNSNEQIEQHLEKILKNKGVVYMQITVALVVMALTLLAGDNTITNVKIIKADETELVSDDSVSATFHYGDSITIDAQAILAIYNGLEAGSNIHMDFNNGVLDPSSISDAACTALTFSLSISKPRFEIT